MTVVLGIDAAWTATEPSGVALAVRQGNRWRSICTAPSYEAFLACASGHPVDWSASNFAASKPDVAALLSCARKLAGHEVSVVAVDMPLATVPISQRRAADRKISREFGGRGCSAHSPSQARPGELGADLTRELGDLGFPLATASTPPPHGTRCTIEVYSHPALLALLECSYRVPYKVSRSLRYWRGSSTGERIRRLLSEFSRIQAALVRQLADTGLKLPAAAEVESLASLKRYEDSIDALVCAWVATRFVDQKAAAYGDDTAAIWVPVLGVPPSDRGL